MIESLRNLKPVLVPKDDAKNLILGYSDGENWYVISPADLKKSLNDIDLYFDHCCRVEIAPNFSDYELIKNSLTSFHQTAMGREAFVAFLNEGKVKVG